MALLDDIAQIIGDAVPGAGLTRPATLIKVTEGISSPGQVSGGSNPVTQAYAAQGIVGDYRDAQIDGTSILKGDRQVRLFGTTIANRKIPVPGDRIIIEGQTLTIVADGVTRDAAGACFVCQCRV